ncbi:hypothetical protein [Porphyrobacter sp. YT40]|uniref:hypothetical protein n=1 Tax=Porphyrobacter sp. YT40 TaxID=2547601 RepID=UPI00114416E7|nr:hypothetical protein [Porphyrobacter sp. YT40]QDH34650.1 hypothetical protein E2E27_10140 [Porphyrobacter sp. YT40]
MLAATATVAIAPSPAPTSSGDVIGMAGVLVVAAFVAWRGAILLHRLMPPSRYLLGIVIAGLMPLLFVLCLLILILAKTDGVTLENAAAALSRMPIRGRMLLAGLLVVGFGVASATIGMRRRRDALRSRTDIGTFQ